nr:hypothetical protein GCM10020093_060680 [Planobispora longispora]
MSREILPVADQAQVRAYARRLTLKYPRELTVTLTLHGLAAVAGLTVPWLLGGLVDDIEKGAEVHVTAVALAVVGFLALQALLVRFAVLTSSRLGEKVLAELREEFVGRVLGLPLSTVERAGSGDLISRTSRDVDALSRTVRYAVPETLIAMVTITISVGALLLAGPLLMVLGLSSAPLLWFTTRWYLRRATAGYLRESAAYADMTDGLAETVNGARTVEALGLQERRHRRTDTDIARSWAAERYTLGLRTVWFPAVDFSYVIPIAVTLVAGGLFYIEGGSRWPRSRWSCSTCSSSPTRSTGCSCGSTSSRSAGPRWPACWAWPRCPTTARPVPASPTGRNCGRRACATPTAAAMTCCTAST